MLKLVAISGAVAVSVAAAVVVGRAAGGDVAAQRTPATTAVSLVKRADAVAPQRGADYGLLTTLRGRDARRAAGVTASGEILLSWWTGFNETAHHALLDPASGRRSPLPDLGGRTRVLAATHRTVTFARPAQRWGLDIVRLDRASGRWRHFTLPEVRGRQYSILGLDGTTVWFKTGPSAEHTSPDDVWSVRFRHPATLVHQGRRSTPAFADGVLSWVVRSLSMDGPDVIAMRDAAGGRATKVPLPENCKVDASATSLLGNGSLLAVDAFCGDRPTGPGGAGEVRTSPTFVVDRTAGVVTELRVESDEGATGVSDRTVSFDWYSYDLATGKLYDVSDRTDLAGTPPTTGPGDRPVAIWPRGTTVGHLDPTRVLVVRLR